MSIFYTPVYSEARSVARGTQAVPSSQTVRLALLPVTIRPMPPSLKWLLSFSVPSAMALACAPTALGPVTFSTNYERVAERSQISLVPPCASVKSVTVVDARSDKNHVGSRATEKHRGNKHPLTLSGGAEDWVVSGALDNLKLAGIRPTKEGRATIEIKLLDLELTEVTSTRSNYSALVTLDARVATTTVGKGFQVVGSSKHSGPSGARAHYNETLNLALDGAMAKLLAAPDFSATLCAQ